MFNWKKKKQVDQKSSKSLRVVAPVQGTLLDIESVHDEVFSSKMMGEGFAVQPDNGNVVAPVSGKAVTVFPTGHAVGITTDAGIDVLVHIGIDTVSLEGRGFKTLITQGDHVEAGQSIVSFDKKSVEDHGLHPTTMVIFTEGFKRPIKVKSRHVNAGDELIAL